MARFVDRVFRGVASLPSGLLVGHDPQPAQRRLGFGQFVGDPVVAVRLGPQHHVCLGRGVEVAFDEDRESLHLPRSDEGLDRDVAHQRLEVGELGGFDLLCGPSLAGGDVGGDEVGLSGSDDVLLGRDPRLDLGQSRLHLDRRCIQEIDGQRGLGLLASDLGQPLEGVLRQGRLTLLCTGGKRGGTQESEHEQRSRERAKAGGHGAAEVVLVQRAPVGVAMVLGGRLLELVPTALVGGILIAFGSSTLVEWIWKSRHRFARFEVEIVIAIVVAVALFGFVAGTVFGIGLAVALFVLRYSRVSVIRHELSGSVITSNVDRTPSEQRRLESRSAEVLVLELRGYLFFGTATAVAEAVARRSTPPRALRSVVFDFSKVTGVDSSTVVAFETIGRLTARAGATLYVAGALPTIEALLLRPIARRGDVVVVSADDIDRALEQCEDHMLHEGRAQARRPPQQVTTYDVLTPVLNDADAVDSVLAHLERRTVDAGEVLVEQGAVSSGLFFLESGRLTARRRVDPVSDRRLRTMLPGTVVGEIGLYLDQPATATVQADEDSVVLWLSPVAFAHLMECEPRVAASLHLYVARILADRVNHTERVTRRLRE